MQAADTWLNICLHFVLLPALLMGPATRVMNKPPSLSSPSSTLPHSPSPSSSLFSHPPSAQELVCRGWRHPVGEEGGGGGGVKKMGLIEGKEKEAGEGGEEGKVKYVKGKRR